MNIAMVIGGIRTILWLVDIVQDVVARLEQDSPDMPGGEKYKKAVAKVSAVAELAEEITESVDDLLPEIGKAVDRVVKTYNTVGWPHTE